MIYYPGLYVAYIHNNISQYRMEISPNGIITTHINALMYSGTSLSSVTNVTFMYLATPEPRTPLYLI